MAKGNDPDDLASATTKMTEALQQIGFGAMPGFGTEWFEMMNAMGSEMLVFVANRIKQDVQIQHDILHAKGLAEVQQIQSAFLQKAMDDYAAETARLMELGKDMAPGRGPLDNADAEKPDPE